MVITIDSILALSTSSSFDKFLLVMNNIVPKPLPKSIISAKCYSFSFSTCASITIAIASNYIIARIFLVNLDLPIPCPNS
ncbi:hypothetical protein HYD56_00910 [Mycoplasmopsis bovis]|nr:hypothetical protein [Mycoplasmopsis bovis]QQH66522.1 hypothetical protein HYD56_00910 [Mycoplasmopsis bovis]